MNRRTIGWIVAAAISIIVLAAFAEWVEYKSAAVLAERYAPPVAPLRAPVLPDAAAEGLRLAHLNGCFSCHRATLTGGFVSHGVFGFHLTAPNLTRVTRSMTDAQIATAIRLGIGPDGRALFDMPSDEYVRLSDQDVAAIIAWLRTLAPKPDAAPPTQWDFEGRLLLTFGYLKNEAEAVDRASLGPVETPASPVALGRYLALSQCTGCHAADLGGDPEMHSPDLRGEAQHYTLAQFRRFFATGKPRKGNDTVIMSHAINVALRYLTPEDVGAIYAYLRTPQRRRK